MIENLAIENAVLDKSKLNHLIESLKDCGELSYFNHIASDLGFQNAWRWSTLEHRCRSDIESNALDKIMCTVDSLETILDCVAIRADHTYAISALSSSDAAIVRSSILKIKPLRTIEASSYPKKITFEPNKVYSSQIKLCKVVDIDDGYAMIFSSIVAHKQHLGSNNVYSQAFHTVFVPNTRDRIEFRVSNCINANMMRSEISRLRDAFINEINLSASIFDFEFINVFKVIASIYEDKNEGRINFAKMSTFEDAGDLICDGKTDPIYCSRNEFTQTQNTYGNDYFPRAIKVKYKYETNSDDEMEIAITPHRNQWENNECFLFSISQPKNHLTLLKMIDNILSRS